MRACLPIFPSHQRGPCHALHAESYMTGRKVTATKALDADLEAYMTGTKKAPTASLDADLEAYMAGGKKAPAAAAAATTADAAPMES